MHPAIAQHRPGISAIRQRYRIQRLDVFGSAAQSDDFDASSSDADFLVDFDANMPVGLDAFFGAKADLEKRLGRGVDLVEPGAIRNLSYWPASTATGNPFMQRDLRAFLWDVRTTFG